jgi:hypothetical protein
MSGDRFNNPTDYGQDAFDQPVLAESPIVVSPVAHAHMRAMLAKEHVFKAQDATSQGWEKATVEERRTLLKFEKRLAKVRAELEALGSRLQCVKYTASAGRSRGSDERRVSSCSRCRPRMAVW